MKTAEKIRFLRLRKGLTQEELGKLCGVQRAAINKYEKGTVVNIKKDMLQKLAHALDVTPVDLLDDNEEFILISDGVYMGSELASIEEELISKIRRLSKSNQYLVRGMIDSCLELQSKEMENYD